MRTSTTAPAPPAHASLVDDGLRPDHLVDCGTTYVSATATHHLTLYRHASGALVFGAGTVQWPWGLDPNHDTGPDTGSPNADPNIQQATMNLFADMGVQPLTPMSGMITAPASTDVAPPMSTVTVTAQRHGRRRSQHRHDFRHGDRHRRRRRRGRGSVGGRRDDLAPRQRPQELDLHLAAAASSAAVTIKSRAVDDTGNLEAPGTGAGVYGQRGGLPLLAVHRSRYAVEHLGERHESANEVGVKFRADVTA